MKNSFSLILYKAEMFIFHGCGDLCLVDMARPNSMWWREARRGGSED
jgi:hypothetical protein